MNQTHFRRTLLQLIGLAILAPSLANAAEIQWIGGNGIWDQSTANWTPADEPDPDDDVIISNSLVDLGMSNTIRSLTLNHIDGRLRTRDYQLNIGGSLTISGNTNGQGAVFQAASNDASVVPPAVSLVVGDVLVANGAQFRMANTVVVSDAFGIGNFHLFNGGTLHGNGTLHFADNFTGTNTVFQNNGVISVGNVTDSLLPFTGSPPARTLSLTAAAAGAQFDLDGNGSGVINVGRNGTLDVNGKVTDFGGNINLAHNSTLDFSDTWFLGQFSQTGATLTVDNGFVPGNILAPSIPADTAYVKGGQVIMDNPNTVIDMVDDDGGLTFDAKLFASLGTIEHRGTLTFNDETWIGAGVHFQNVFNSKLNINSLVTVNDTDWDWDSTGSVGQLTINEGGHLVANITAPTADTSWSAMMTLAGGTLEVEAHNNAWSQNAGFIDVVPAASPSQIVGDRFTHLAGSFQVAASANVDMWSDNKWGNGSLVVDGGMNIHGATEWDGAHVTGSGALKLHGGSLVTDDSTIAVSALGWDLSPTTVNPGKTLTLDVDFLDQNNNSYEGNQILLNSGKLDVAVSEGEWSLTGTNSSNAGRLVLNNTGGGFPQLDGDLLVVKGTGTVEAKGGASWITAPLRLESGGEVKITDTGASISILDDLTLDGGNIVDNIDRSLFDSRVNILAPLVVSGDSTVNVELFDWDGAATTVQPGGILRMHSLSIEGTALPQQYDHVLTLNSGDADVVLGPSFSHWTIGHRLHMNNTQGSIPTLSGTHVHIGNDDVTSKSHVVVGGSGVSEIAADATYNADAIVEVSPGATLRHRGTTNFQSQNAGTTASFTGAGSLVLGGDTYVKENTTIAMSGGTVDLDNSSFLAGGVNQTVLQAWLTIHAATLEDFGVAANNDNSLITILPGERLTVDLDDAAASWTINENGVLHYLGNSVLTTFLQGNDVVMNGVMQVGGEGRSGARMDIGGQIDIFEPNGVLQLGGLLGGGPNRLIDGSIVGPGTLTSSGIADLFGYGTIQVDVDFDGSLADLMADDGQLTIDGIVLDVGTFGTADHDGILHVTNSWNTNVADLVRLNGGSLTGATVVNHLSSGISGHGTIVADVINESRIDAVDGTLIVDNPMPNHLDGLANNGSLNAVSGDLVVQFPLDTFFSFLGTIRADQGTTFFGDRASMVLMAGSSLDLNGGTFRANLPTYLNGFLDAESAKLSTIHNDQLFEFGAQSVSNLMGDLQLIGNSKVINGATIIGSGTLTNTVNSHLTMSHGVTIGADLRNEGRLSIGESIGQVSGTNVEQSDTGLLELHLAGVAQPDFDQLALTGSALLDGTLELNLSGGFQPSLNDTFTVLSATSGVTGTFDIVDVANAQLGPGLAWDVVYNPDSVQLMVIQGSILCDFDASGVCDIADLDLLYTAIAASDLAYDIDASGTTDNDDIAAWLAEAGQSNGKTYLPGDTDLDGSVLGNDFTTLAVHFGQSPKTWGQGNFDGNHGGSFTVGGSDFTALASNFGFTSLATVPEPETMPCLMVAGILLMMGGRRRGDSPRMS